MPCNQFYISFITCYKSKIVEKTKLRAESKTCQLALYNEGATLYLNLTFTRFTQMAPVNSMLDRYVAHVNI